MSAEPVQDIDNPRPKYIRGRERFNLVQDLASGDFTQEELATKYDRHRSAITQFIERNRAEIEEAKQAQEDRFRVIYLADKFNRLADTDEDADLLRHDLHNPRRTWDEKVKIAHALAKLRKDIAEELGDLPTRTSIQIDSAPVVTHEVKGWDPAKWAAESKPEHDQE